MSGVCYRVQGTLLLRVPALMHAMKSTCPARAHMLNDVKQPDIDSSLTSPRQDWCRYQAHVKFRLAIHHHTCISSLVIFE